MLLDSILSFLVGWETNPLNIPKDVPEGHKAVGSGTKDRVDTWPSREQKTAPDNLALDLLHSKLSITTEVLISS